MSKLKLVALVVVLAAAGGFGMVQFAPCDLPPALLAKLGKTPTCAPAETVAAVREVAPPAISVVEAVKREFVDRLFVSGTLVAREEADVAPRIDGLSITALLAEDGDRVAAGQVLVRLDRSQLDALVAQNDAATQRADAAIAQTKSAIAQSEAQLGFASSDFDRAQKLGGNVMSLSTIQQRETAMKTAQAQLASTRDALSVAEADRKSRDAERRELMVRIARTEVRAPVAGIVSRRAARVGALATNAGEPLFRIIEGGEIDLEAEVPEQSLPRLTAGMPASIKLPGVAAPVAGRVRLVDQEVDRASRTGKVRIALTDLSAAHIGAFAAADVVIARRDVVAAPSSAIKLEGDAAEALVVRDGKVERRKVTPGIVDGDTVELRDGVTAGETIVARASAFLRSGDRIRPMPQSTMASQ